MGVGGSIMNSAAPSTVNYPMRGLIWNRGSEASQIAWAFAGTSTPSVNATVDTSVDFNMSITVQLAQADEFATVEGWEAFANFGV